MARISNIRVMQVNLMPSEMANGVLYVSARYKTAAHLCCCGCGSKIVTPLKPSGWRLSGHQNAPTLRPSVGNWNLPCRSHYFISGGKVQWARQWSEAEIQAGRWKDDSLRRAHFDRAPLPIRVWRRCTALLCKLKPW